MKKACILISLCFFIIFANGCEMAKVEDYDDLEVEILDEGNRLLITSSKEEVAELLAEDFGDGSFESCEVLEGGILDIRLAKEVCEYAICYLYDISNNEIVFDSGIESAAYKISDSSFLYIPAIDAEDLGVSASMVSFGGEKIEVQQVSEVEDVYMPNVAVSADNKTMAVYSDTTNIIDFYSIGEEISFISSSQVLYPSLLNYQGFNFATSAKFYMSGDGVSIENFTINANPKFNIPLNISENDYAPKEVVIPDSYDVVIAENGKTVSVIDGGAEIFKMGADEIYDGEMDKYEILIEDASFFAEKILEVSITVNAYNEATPAVLVKSWVDNFFINIDTKEVLFSVADIFYEYTDFDGARRLYLSSDLNGVSCFLHGDGGELAVQRFEGEENLVLNSVRTHEDALLFAHKYEKGTVDIYIIEDTLVLIESYDLGIDVDSYGGFDLLFDATIFENHLVFEFSKVVETQPVL